MIRIYQENNKLLVREKDLASFLEINFPLSLHTFLFRNAGFPKREEYPINEAVVALDYKLSHIHPALSEWKKVRLQSLFDYLKKFQSLRKDYRRLING